MPFYDVKCKNKECNTVTEVMCKAENQNKQKCPKCGNGCKALVGGSDFRLRGAGWVGLELANEKNWGGGNKRWESS